MTLPDETIVYPGHGAGSACGKNMSKETVGTLGDQKATNYALRDYDERRIRARSPRRPPAPSRLFPAECGDEQGWVRKHRRRDARGTRALSPDAFEAAANETSAVVLDVRPTAEFIERHVPRSTFIGLQGGFASWVGAVLST